MHDCEQKGAIQELQKEVSKLKTDVEVTKEKVYQYRDDLIEIKDMLQRLMQGETYSNKEMTEMVLKYVALFLTILGLIGGVAGFIFTNLP